MGNLCKWRTFMKTIVLFSFASLIFAHGLTSSASGTVLAFEGEAVVLKQETEPFQYYQVVATSDMRRWETASLPEFLGMGEKSEIPLPLWKEVGDGETFFAVVIPTTEIPAFDPENGPPVRRISYRPNHPQQLLKQGIEGSVTLDFVVNSEGEVLNPTVLSSTDERFNEAALDAVKLWNFIPFRENGIYYASRARLPINFKIRLGKPFIEIGPVSRAPTH